MGIVKQVLWGWLNLDQDSIYLDIDYIYTKMLGYLSVKEAEFRSQLIAARIIAWSNIQPMSKKKIKIEDVIKFHWENGNRQSRRKK